jgi:hypothetical protein
VILSVGVLYSSQELIHFVGDRFLSIEDFRGSFRTFAVASATEVLDLVQRCNWIALSADGRMTVTERGLAVTRASSQEVALRVQIKHVIEILQPAWAQRMRNGRMEVRDYLPSEVRQCFQEADLLGDWTDDLIQWWDDLAQTARARKNDELLRIGRQAEQLSMKYEAHRTRSRPRWQSLESNFSGFDILSIVDETDRSPLRIEVKGTTLPKKQAYCLVTRNEWDVANTSGSYRFHFWLMSMDPPTLIEKDYTQVATHVPTDRGGGQWQNLKINISQL